MGSMNLILENRPDVNGYLRRERGQADAQILPAGKNRQPETLHQLLKVERVLDSRGRLPARSRGRTHPFAG